VLALRLYGQRHLGVDALPDPPQPGEGEVLVELRAAGICGSDLHMYIDGRIGDTVLGSPLVPGHEFSAVVAACGPRSLDGNGAPLRIGTRIAVEPAISCGTCPPCRRDDPHLCDGIRFLGHSPVDGCLRERMLVPAGNCFPIPDSMSDAAGALLEPLGVAIQGMRLASLRRGDCIAVIGAGPIGSMLIRLAVLAGASRVFAVEPLSWRREIARKWGATVFEGPGEAEEIVKSTGGVDVAIEAAWGGGAVQAAADMTRPGGRLVLVGIPGDDLLTLKHSTGRRKELSVQFSRRMKHTYPDAIALVDSGMVRVDELVSHTFGLEEGPEAFRMNSAYDQDVHKVILVPR
jgi:L-iditol 2-dehydrogenase